MTATQLANLLSRIQAIPMPADVLAEVKGAVFLTAAGFPAEVTP